MSLFRPEILALQPSGIGKVAADHLGDPEVIPLWFGESDFATAPFIRDAAKDALDGGKTFYGEAHGHPPLRTAIKTYLDQLYGLDIDPERINSPGSTMLTVMLACQTLVNPGDEVVLVSPYWPNIRTVIEILGGRTVDVRLEEGPVRWHLDMAKIRAAVTPRTKAVYVNTPSNPTGWIMTREEQEDLLSFTRERGLAIIADEVYHRNTFSVRDPAPSFMEIAGPEEPVFVLNGFSKGWAMTGWRLGWMVHPRQLATSMKVMAQVSSTGSTAFVQYGGIAALQQGEAFVQEFQARVRHNRDLIMDILGTHPRVSMMAPEGSFYVFPKIEGLSDSLAFCQRLVREKKVGTAAGYTFGEGNDSHIRLCFAIHPDRLKVALLRISEVLDKMN